MRLGKRNGKRVAALWRRPVWFVFKAIQHFANRRVGEIFSPVATLVKRVAEVVMTFSFKWFAESLDDFRYGLSFKVSYRLQR